MQNLGKHVGKIVESSSNFELASESVKLARLYHGRD